MKEHEDSVDKMDWFVNRYLKWMEKYKDIIDLPETIEDYYTEEEINMICRCVETECFECNFDSKCNVASIILNRDNDDGFDGSIIDIITQDDPVQFAYGRKVVSYDTYLAVRYAFEIDDTTDGCLFFENTSSDIHRLSYDYVFTDESGHKFFRYREVILV